MYMAGLEIDLEEMKSLPTREIVVMHAYFACIVLFAILAVLLLNQPPFFLLLYCTMAIGLLYPVLREMRLLHGEFGKNILILASVAEIYVLLAFTFFVVQHKFGFTPVAAMQILYVFLFSFAAYLFLRFLQLWLWWFPSLISVFVKTGNLSESGIRSNFVIMLSFVALAMALGIEPIIGAFIGGILFSAIFKEKENIRESFSTFGNGFLIPIFFIYVGFQFDHTMLSQVQVVLDALAFSLVFLLIRIFGLFPFFFSRRNMREVMIIPLATSFPLTLLVAFGQLGQSLGMISDRVTVTIVLAAMICALVYPSLMRFIGQRLLIPSQPKF